MLSTWEVLRGSAEVFSLMNVKTVSANPGKVREINGTN